MTLTNNTPGKEQWLLLFSGVVLIISFFLPWVSWEGIPVTGSAMPSGNFFATAETNFRLGNPFPQLSFTFLIFWLIPVFAALVFAFILLKKKYELPAYIAGSLSLSLISIFLLFTNTLLTLGIGKSVLSMLRPWLFIQGLAAAGMILFAGKSSGMLKKTGWLIIGPVIAFSGFLFIENYLENETHKDTMEVKADFTITAPELIKEFITNDIASNKKYLNKVIVVDGNAAAVNVKSDSTSTVKIEDNSGSYLIFAVEKSEYDKVKNIQPGDQVSLKGICSGSIFSEILETTSISFKRTIINKN